MSRGINRVALLGNLGNDPEIKQDGRLAKFSVATSESWKDKNTNETVTRTEWHRITVFGKLADVCGKYLKKGSKVYLEGQLRTHKWQGEDGSDRYTTEVLVDVKGTMLMLDVPGDSQPRQSAAPKQQADDFEDAIPF